MVNRWSKTVQHSLPVFYAFIDDSGVLERTLGRKSLEIEILKNVVGE
jgi:hypothetical protein